jgi:hypothetical protein
MITNNGEKSLFLLVVANFPHLSRDSLFQFQSRILTSTAKNPTPDRPHGQSVVPCPFFFYPSSVTHHPTTPYISLSLLISVLCSGDDNGDVKIFDTLSYVSAFVGDICSLWRICGTSIETAKTT